MLATSEECNVTVEAAHHHNLEIDDASLFCDGSSTRSRLGDFTLFDPQLNPWPIVLCIEMLRNISFGTPRQVALCWQMFENMSSGIVFDQADTFWRGEEHEDDDDSRRFLEHEFFNNTCTEPSPRIGLRFEPPISKRAQPLLRAVLEDFGRFDFSGLLLQPKMSKIGQRADVESLLFCASTLRTLPIPLEDQILWIFYMHKVHRRCPLTTALCFLRTIKDPRCSEANARGLEQHLTSLFADSETFFDIPIPQVGGLPVFRRMLSCHSQLMEHALVLAQSRDWSVSKQSQCLPDNIGMGQRYAKGHHMRAMALVSEIFHGSLPPCKKPDWDILMTHLPGSALGANHSGVLNYTCAKAFCAAVNVQLKQDTGALVASTVFHEYDLGGSQWSREAVKRLSVLRLL